MVQAYVGQTRIALQVGDLTEVKVEAIVNAANSSLMGGGGVDGAIHRAGGPLILEECRQIVKKQGPLPPGQAVLTTAGELPASYVIHTVGPIWQGGSSQESEVLSSAYLSSLELAVENGIKQIAFPSISTGAYHYPIEQAAKIALTSIAKYVGENPGRLEEVLMILHSNEDFKVYLKAWEIVIINRNY